MNFPDQVLFPHYFAFLVRETEKANQKRIDRELKKQFGIDEGYDETR